MEPLEAKKRIDEIREQYTKVTGGDVVGYSALIKGIEGSGKTTFATTGRLPILIDLFDSRGFVLFHTDPELIAMRERGELIVRPFIDEDSTKPTEYARWEKQWKEDVKSGFLGLFGTYVIDSGTTWMEALSNYIRVKKGRGDNLQLQDYVPIYNLVMDIIKISTSQGCDFIYIAHLIRLQEGDTGWTTEMDIYKGLKSKIPKLFAEKYCLVKKPSAHGAKHELLIHSTGRYEASSQLKGRGDKLKSIEEPNLKKLLEKAGLSTKDKPLLWKE